MNFWISRRFGLLSRLLIWRELISMTDFAIHHSASGQWLETWSAFFKTYLPLSYEILSCFRKLLLGIVHNSQLIMQTLLCWAHTLVIFQPFIIIIIILSCHQHGYPWPSLATSPYRSSLLVGPQSYTLYRHRAAVCRSELVALTLLGHVKGSIGVHPLWARPYFSSSVLHVWFIIILISFKFNIIIIYLTFFLINILIIIYSSIYKFNLFMCVYSIGLYYKFILCRVAQLAEAVEYTDCFLA